MVLGAASLFERVDWTRSSHALPPAPPLLDTITEAWTKAYAPGNPAALLRRLAWDDLDRDAVAAALIAVIGARFDAFMSDGLAPVLTDLRARDWLPDAMRFPAVEPAAPDDTGAEADDEAFAEDALAA